MKHQIYHLTDDFIKSDPSYFYWIDKYQDLITRMGYRRKSLVEQYNLAQDFRLVSGD